ncbi:hypothetical protein PsorP6_015854 [Peronosclerospora sorghi]|uniref:Uncharacterized protein n=1 Tax=Peronosclerospora sorghi TaxID=230839 RepID=A0ACC0WPK8_9STRA|nr:hypothetical protein PsorP6_015854 [Peronosclerospora sorghi]
MASSSHEPDTLEMEKKGSASVVAGSRGSQDASGQAMEESVTGTMITLRPLHASSRMKSVAIRISSWTTLRLNSGAPDRACLEAHELGKRFPGRSTSWLDRFNVYEAAQPKTRVRSGEDCGWSVRSRSLRRADVPRIFRVQWNRYDERSKGQSTGSVELCGREFTEKKQSQPVHMYAYTGNC